MALAASLGTSMDLDPGDWDQTLREDSQGLSAKPKPESPRGGRPGADKDPADRIRD